MYQVSNSNAKLLRMMLSSSAEEDCRLPSSHPRSPSLEIIVAQGDTQNTHTNITPGHFETRKERSAVVLSQPTDIDLTVLVTDVGRQLSPRKPSTPYLVSEYNL